MIIAIRVRRAGASIMLSFADDSGPSYVTMIPWAVASSLYAQLDAFRVDDPAGEDLGASAYGKAQADLAAITPEPARFSREPVVGDS